MDPPLSPPPPLSQNLSSLLLQLQGSASSTPPPSAALPSASGEGRTLDDLFSSLGSLPSSSAAVPTSQALPASPAALSNLQYQSSTDKRNLLDIFNSTSPASPPPPPPPAQHQPSSQRHSVLNGQGGAIAAGVVGGSGEGGPSLLELLMGGALSPPTFSNHSYPQPPTQSFSPPLYPSYQHQGRMDFPLPSSPSPPSFDPTQDERPSEQPVPFASLPSPSPPALEHHPIVIAAPPRQPEQQQSVLSTSPPPKVRTPSLFAFVSDFDAFGPPPSTKRSKSAIPPGSAAVVPITRSISNAPPPRRSEEELDKTVIDGLPSTFTTGHSFLDSSSPISNAEHTPTGLPTSRLFPDLFPSSKSLPVFPLSSPPTPSHTPFSQDEHGVRTPLSLSMSNVVISATGTTAGDESSSSKTNRPQLGEHSRTGSGSFRASRGEVVVGGSYKAKGFLEAERKHRRTSSWDNPRAPQNLTDTKTTIDVSLPNLDSLVQSDVVQKKAITIIPSPLAFAPGRTVGSSKTGAIAYCMNKGRVRLLEADTGARALLKLPTDWFARDAQVANLELEGNHLACVTTDGGLIVWRFPSPSTWTQEEPECEIMYSVAASEDEGSQFKLVKWRGESTLGVSSGSTIVLIDLPTVSKAWLETSPHTPATPELLFDGENTRRISFSADPVVGFGFIGSGRAFRVAVLSSNGQSRGSLATLSVTDEGESIYSVVEELKDCNASSIAFVDEKTVVVGSEKDTVAKVFSLVQSGEQQSFSLKGSVRFEKPAGATMFGKIEWDPKRELLWIANTARSSLFAFRLHTEPDASIPFTQVAEFPIDQSLSSFDISVSSDLEIYSVSPVGIDYITISDAFLQDLFVPTVAASTHEHAPEESVAVLTFETEAVEISLEAPASQSSLIESKPATSPVANGSTSSTTVGRSRRKAKAAAAAASIPPPDDPSFGGSAAPASTRSHTQAPASSSGGGEGVSSGLLAEIKKVEENIKTKVSALLEKQSNRLETNDLLRQERVFSLIAQELKTNTTNVLTSSVQSEMRASILPALLEVTRDEIQTLVQAEISKGLREAMVSSLPSELERHLNSRAFASVVFPSIDKAIKDIIHETLVPAYNDATAEMYEALSREIRADMVAIRKEVVSEQSNALVETHSLVQDMSKTILALGTQVYDLQKMVAKLSSQVASSTSSSAPPPNLPSAPTAAPPPSSSSHLNGPPFHHHHQSPHVASHPINVLPSTSAYPVHLRNPSSSAPQPQFTPLFPQQAQPQAQALPPLQDPADLDDLWTEALMDPNPSALPQLVSMISPQALDLMLPISDAHGTSPLSQTVVLTLVHKFTDLLSKTSPQSTLFPTALVFIQRAARILDPSDPIVAPYASRVLSAVLMSLQEIEAGVARSGGAGLGERERETVLRMLRGVVGELAGKR